MLGLAHLSAIIISIYAKIDLFLLAVGFFKLYIFTATMGLLIFGMIDFVYGVTVNANWREVMVSELKYRVPQIASNHLWHGENKFYGAITNIGPEVLHSLILQKIDHPYRGGDNKFKMSRVDLWKENAADKLQILGNVAQWRAYYQGLSEEAKLKLDEGVVYKLTFIGGLGNNVHEETNLGDSARECIQEFCNVSDCTFKLSENDPDSDEDSSSSSDDNGNEDDD